MIYDCFTFFNELDLLEIRLNILNDVVDKFVLVEATKTHSGKDKPLYFNENKERFKDFEDKIIHIIVDDFPQLDISKKDKFGNRWILENFQRDAIMRGLSECKPSDIILISDVDEIPNPDAIKKYKNGICVLEQKMMYYFINTICVTDPMWDKAKIGRYSDLLNPQQDLPQSEFYEFSKKGLPTYFRFCEGKHIKNAGWHFSYCGGLDAIIKKRQSIVEQQYNTEENMRPENILNAIKRGKDILNRDGKIYLTVKLDKSFPKYIINNLERYKKLINFENQKNYFCYQFKEFLKNIPQNIFSLSNTYIENKKYKLLTILWVKFKI